MGPFLAFVIAFLVLIWYIQYLRKHNKIFSETSATLSFPRIEWTGIEIIDGCISLIKLRKDLLLTMDTWVASHGHTFLLPLALEKTIATADLNIIQKTLSSIKRDHHNKPRAIYTALFTDVLKDGLVVSDVDIWEPHRKAISRAFTYKSLLSYSKFINKEAIQLVQSANLSATKNSDETLNNEIMMSLIDLHVSKITVQLIMGSEGFVSDDEVIQLSTSFKRIKEMTVNRFLNPVEMIPAVWKIHPNKRLLEHLCQDLHKLSDKITDRHRIYISANKDSSVSTKNANDTRSISEVEDIGVKPSECLLEKMIKDGSNNDEITDEVNTFLVAGYETIMIALEMLIFHMAGNMEVQKKCQQEIDELFEDMNNACSLNVHEGLTMEDFSKLKYLDRCILESLRITPPLPYIIRRLDSPLQVDKECCIPEGNSIMIMHWALHRNPEIYPNPEVFDPDRFLPDNVKSRHPYAFIPFSMGPRNCIGRKLALVEIKILMAWILRTFDLATTDRFEDVKILYNITLKPERLYNVTFKKRCVKE